ncbi:class I adenylate-forming enzyme family protein [Duganella violaceipulchra]|uniref:AMP-binding protein n=1 Tax=Duganella violaceipulchra TaxID=2849652 RepID=A0AA41H4R6_9BURK|nr:AMP-binding protein [Duganella violaceicalia]MBV6319785.1 AMP-binding protein [Duganella violaceicalia]MCP2006400.1 acyl-CoA synthetase (AMP-forming)/AMP-acid ligase II [Duganella violaceicalia]
MEAIATDHLLATLPERLSGIPRRWAERAPQSWALHDGARHWTYAELAAAVDETAALLRTLQVRPGDRLMVVGENCAAQVALIFAAAEVDAWIVNVNGRLSAREVDQILDHSGARRAIYLSMPASPESTAHGQRHGAVSTPSPFGAWMIGALNPDCMPEPAHADPARQVAALIYTTGTTGQPKGVMLTHRNLLFIAAVSSTLRGLTPTDRAYGVLPITHVYGLASVMLGTLYAGACLHLCPRFTPDAVLKAIRDDGLTILQGVPAMYARLLETLGGGEQIASRLRFLYAGGSPLAPSLKAQVQQLFGLPLHNGYGMTETSPTVSQTRLDRPRDDASVGQVIPGVEVRLVDAGGDDVAPGDDGELWVRGPNVMAGYYREPELTAAAMRDGGWLNTGDVARQDADGALFIVGRTKELIIRSGFNVYPLEVETVLNAHPAVTQSAVVGRNAADGNEEVVAFVEIDPRHRVTCEELQHYLAGLLSPYKCPSEIIAMQALPAAATGKILKGQLRQLAQK